LAWAFNLSVEQVRLIRRAEEAGGVEALLNRPSRGPKPKLTPALYKSIFKAFDAGKQVKDVHAARFGYLSPIPAQIWEFFLTVTR